jgi:hypothetical protein
MPAAQAKSSSQNSTPDTKPTSLGWNHEIFFQQKRIPLKIKIQDREREKKSLDRLFWKTLFRLNQGPVL